jgi:hypothetical protein
MTTPLFDALIITSIAEPGGVLAQYARKNVGYLLALQQGAQVSTETDDDNLPRAAFWRALAHSVMAPCATGAGWTNKSCYFTDAHIWPRAFPLEAVAPPPRAALLTRTVDRLIQQGLADENPDVDAVYRMTQPLPLKFERSKPVAPGASAWCPFNSPSTIWFSDALPLLYLPSYCASA